MLYLNTPPSSVSNLVLYPCSVFGGEIIFVIGSIQSGINGQYIPTPSTLWSKWIITTYKKKQNINQVRTQKCENI